MNEIERKYTGMPYTSLDEASLAIKNLKSNLKIRDFKVIQKIKFIQNQFTTLKSLYETGFEANLIFD